MFGFPLQNELYISLKHNENLHIPAVKIATPIHSILDQFKEDKSVLEIEMSNGGCTLIKTSEVDCIKYIKWETEGEWTTNNYMYLLKAA